jgi:hypothetical protein
MPPRKEPKDVDTRVRVPPELYEWIKRKAEQEGRSINNMMLRLFERARAAEASERAQPENDLGKKTPAPRFVS